MRPFLVPKFHLEIIWSANLHFTRMTVQRKQSFQAKGVPMGTRKTKEADLSADGVDCSLPEDYARTMNVEFTAELSGAGTLAIPPEILSQLPVVGPVRVIFLTGEEVAAEREWRAASYEQFLADDPPEDAIHDSPPSEAPNPWAALDFARRHGLEDGSTELYLQELRDGETEDSVSR